jgi:hypothetical protein
MPTPTTYFNLTERHEHLRAVAFKLVMSDAVTFDTPECQALFDLVGDMTERDANETLAYVAKTEAEDNETEYTQ